MSNVLRLTGEEHQLYGYLDFICQIDGVKTIVDIKTSRSYDELVAAMSTQLTFYALATGIPDVAIISIVKQKRNPSVNILKATRNPERIDEFRNQLTSAIDAIERCVEEDSFTKANNKLTCQMCELKLLCFGSKEEVDMKFVQVEEGDNNRERSAEQLTKKKEDRQRIDSVPALQEMSVYSVQDKAHCFFVDAGDSGSSYKVMWNGKKSLCTCSDYKQNGNGYLCAHIRAAKEHGLNHKVEVDPERTESEIAAMLNKPFPPEMIKARPDGLRFIDSAQIIQRLNDAFGPLNWSFSHTDLVDDGDGQVSCNGRLDVYILGKHISKEQIGSCRYDKFLSRGDARTGAIQYALKKCASLFGIGLKQLYTSSPQQEPKKGIANRNNGSARRNNNRLANIC